MTEPVATWVPRTKLVAPRPGPAVVLEPDLLDAVRTATTTVTLTLLTAQAGSGKTTLAATLAQAAPSGTVAWLTLDAGDDSPGALLHLLAMALDPVVPGGCPALTDLLRAGLPHASDPRRAIGVLVNDVLAGGGPVLLVLDDLHVITDAAARAALGYLLDHAPAVLRVLATARHAPRLGLARRRVRGELVEFGADALACSAVRADSLLNGRLGLRLTHEQIDQVVARSGGWVTGVRLLGESLARGGESLARGGESPARGVGLPDDPRSVHLHDYLVEEVLDDLPEPVARFLLDTSVLDELDPAACAAVALRDDAAVVLADLHGRYPFLVPADERRPGRFRYQRLFVEFLRRRVAAEGPGRAAKLHRRAADAVTEPAARIEHLLAAGAQEEAAGEIERLGRAALSAGAATRAMVAWIDRLDPPCRDRPWLAALAGLDAVDRGELRRAAGLLNAALDRFVASGDVAGQWLAARNLHLATSDHARFTPILAALESTPEFRALPAVAQVDQHVGRGYGALHTGDWDEAARRFTAAIDLTTASRDQAAVEVLARHLGPLPAACDGLPTHIEAYLAWTRRHMPDPPPLVRLGIEQQSALTAYLRGELDDAVGAAERAAQLQDRLGGMPFVRATADWVRAGARFAHGDAAGALAVLDAAAAERTSDLDDALRIAHLGLRARVARQRGELDGLAELARELGSIAPERRYAERLELVAVSVRAQHAWAGRDLDAAAAVLRAGFGLEQRLRLVPGVGSLRLDLALVLADAGRTAEALRELGELLALVGRRGTVGIVVEAGQEAVPLLELAVRRGVGTPTAANALAALRADARPVPVPGSSAVLSAREVEVLRLLAAGASNADLADELVVSVNTVKTHVGRLLTKLGARSRTEAVARAREMHLL